jgi:serine/threonine protein kinase/WD40 repeat protein/Tfp pilus assembly protein PilF
MSNSSEDRNPVERLAEEFADRYRSGERPALSEYVAKYPEYADEIRELFPALVMIEQLKPVSADLTGVYDGDATKVIARRPERLGDYRVLREVGRGGMGVVYEAEQVSLGRHVALKVLPGQALLDPTHLERFRREAKAAAKLHHTNIVPVYGVGEADGVHFYAMQFIRGEGLDRVLNDLRRLRHEPSAVSQGSMAANLLTGHFAAVAEDKAPPDAPSGQAAPDLRPVTTSSSSLSGGPAHAEFHRSAARLVLQVAEALAYAHRQGVLHRDVKPSNLLLDAQGAVWVTDFGLAKAEGTDELTHTGDIVGTVRFMAPERFEGRSLPQSDLYALGLTLYEMLTLRPAFDDTNKAKLIEKVLHEPPVPPRKIDAHVPRDLETVVLKCLAKDPRERYTNAEALAEDLRRFLADRPVKARRASNAERLWRWCRRNPAVASLTAVALVLLVAVAVVASVSAVWLGGERDRVVGANKDLQAQYEKTDEERRRADEECKRAEKAERATGDRLWEAKWSEARALRMSQQVGQRYGGLRAIRAAMKLPLPEGHSLNQLRTEAIAALCLPDFELAKEWDGYPPATTAFTVDDAFERYARADRAGNVSVRRIDDDQELFALPGAGPSTGYEGLRFSPDGRFLHVIAVPQRRGRLWKLDGPRPALVADDDHGGFAFSPDSNRLAAAYPDGTVVFLDCETGKALRRFSGVASGNEGLQWNPKSTEVAVWSRSSWRLLDAETGRLDPLTAVPGGISWVAWHPDGRLLAVSNNTDFKITLWDARTRRPAQLPMEGPRTAGVILCFNRAGDRLLSTDWSSLWRLWDTGTGRQILTMPAGGTHLRFGPDDGMLGTELTPPKVRLHRFASGAEFATLTHWVAAKPGRYCDIWPLALHPKGRLLAVGTPDEVTLIDLARLEEVAHLRVPHTNPLAFEPTGNALLSYGSGGLLRWPVRAGDVAESLTIGSPTRLISTTHGDRWGCSADGRTIAIPEYSQGATVWRSNEGRSVRVGPQDDVRNCALSPNGLWVFTGSHGIKEGPGAKVWDAITGKRAADLATDGGCSGWFSPDGKWLVTNGGGYRAWEVGTWKEGPPLGPLGLVGGCAFRADGKLVALESEPGVVRLVDPATGREAARLTAPEQTRLWPHCFTPDGGKLIAVGVESRALHVFDLRAIRAGLRDLGLDWSDDPLPPAAARAEPLRVTVENGPVHDRVEAQRLYAQAQGQMSKKEYGEAVGFLRQALRADPDFAPAHNDLAWILVAGPENLRDAKEALTLAERAVRLAHDERFYLNTLGVAQYRNGQDREAVLTLEKSLARSQGDYDGFDLFFLAMCHARLGDPAKAKDCFVRAGRWTESQKNLDAKHVEELKAFRAEAEAVLKDQ